jgi:hypothetical protein
MTVQKIASDIVLALEARERIGCAANIDQVTITDDRGGTGAWLVTFRVTADTGKVYDDLYHVSPNGIVEWTSLDENTDEADAKATVFGT